VIPIFTAGIISSNLIIFILRLSTIISGTQDTIALTIHTIAGVTILGITALGDPAQYPITTGTYAHISIREIAIDKPEYERVIVPRRCTEA
jgi:hypothetical protein